MYLFMLNSEMILQLLVLIFVFSCELSRGARILGVVPTPSYSHQVVFRPIWNELSKRGHEVVVITTDPQNDPNLNITEIDVHSAYEVWEKRQVVKVYNDYKFNYFKVSELISETFIDLTTQELLHPEVQNILRNKSEHFDLVMVENLFPPMFGFCSRFKSPCIGMLSFEVHNEFHALLGNPNHPILYPDSAWIGLVGVPDFKERLISVMVALLVKFTFPIQFTYYGGSGYRPFLEKQFGSHLPPLIEIMKNVSMMFINGNPVFNNRPLGPAFVLFGGGIHLTPLKPLPKDLKEYLDGAKNGFIYFSLGTNVKSDVFLPEKRKIVLDVFRELPYKVLWKFDINDIPDVPENVKIVTWLPQQDILRHPNIKLFITQGGLQSIEEAIFSHVPIVGIPHICDQSGNVKKIVAKGGGVILDKDSYTKESFKEALLEVIKNPKYKDSITEIAELYRDQPMTGIEKAVWWTEYVIRHKGARHFRNPGIDIPLYQYYMVDVISVFLAVILVVLFIVYKSIIFIKNSVLRLVKSKTKKVKSQ